MLHSCNVKTQICVTRPQCVKVDAEENGLGAESVDWIHLAQDCVSIIKQLLISHVGENLLNSRTVHLKVYTDFWHWLRWSRGIVLAFSTKVRGFKPGRSHRIFKGEEILSTPSFGGEVKPSVPCRRFATCKRSLNGVEVVISAKISHVVADVEAPGGEKREHLKSGGKQWQTTPKNLGKMQRTRAIPVA